MYRKYSVVASVRRYRVRAASPLPEPFTVRFTPAPCVKDPDFPVKVTVPFEPVAFEAAVNVTGCGVPGCNVIGLGETLTPAGAPLTCTLTCDEKPYSAVTDKDTEAELPASTD